MATPKNSKDLAEQEQAPKALVVLPCQPDQFSDFISKLLGRPQTIERLLRGTFDLGKIDIAAFHHLIEQRLAQQNDAHLVQFTCRLVYDDGSSVLLNNFHDFDHYNEVRPVSSVAAHLSWTYLIKFQDRGVPEKQAIDVSLFGAGEPNLDIDDGPFINPLAGHRGGLINIRIAHTARTWGADIEAMLTAHAKTLLKEQSWLLMKAAAYSGWIAFFAAALFMAGALLTGHVASERFAREQIAQSHAAIASATDTLKVNFLVETIAAGPWPRFYLKLSIFLFSSLIVSILLAIWTGQTAENVPPSFVCLTRESEKRRERMQRKTKRTFISFVCSLLANIVTGIVGNIIFAHFWGAP